MTEQLGNIALATLTLFCVLGAVTSAAQPGKSIRKPASWIKPLKQIREDYGTPDEQRRFGESVKQRQLQPLVCLSDGTLVCGYRRFICGSAAGMTEFDVIVIAEQLTESEVKVYRLTENIQRKDLTPWETWQSCEELMRMNPSWQQRDLAEHLHYDASTISRYLSPSRCIEDAQKALREGRIGISDCYAMSKLEPAAQNGLLAMKLSGASRDAVEAAGRKVRTGAKKPEEKQSRVACPVSTGARVVVTGPAMDLEGLIEVLSAALESARRANRDSLDIKTAEKVWRDKAKAK